MFKNIATLIGISLSLCWASAARADDFVATFYDMSDASFSLEVVAPPGVIREYAVCKAVWFAEKKNAPHMSLSNPSFGSPKHSGPIAQKVPAGWIALQATAYLTASNPDGNPAFSVAEKAGPCRQYWNWYN